MSRVWSGLLCCLVVVGLFVVRPSQAQKADPSSTVWLVRHAEKADDGTTNPPLRKEGRERADALAGMLADKGIVKIITSSQKRTVQTAAPLAKRLKGNAAVVKKSTAKDVAGEIKASKGNVLVVHHSNTVPEIVNTMRGPGAPKLQTIDETVYNRIFVLTLKDGTVACRETTYEDWQKSDKAC